MGGIIFAHFVGEFSENRPKADLVSVNICNSANFIFLDESVENVFLSIG